MPRIRAWQSDRTRSSRQYCAIVVFSLILAATSGQSITPSQSVAKEKSKVHPESSPQTSTTAAEPGDPLGRNTPHGTVVGFLQAAQSGKYEKAAKYLQLSKTERETNGEQIARQLHELMDSAFVGRVGAISERGEGSEQEGVPPDHEQIGVLRIADSEINVDLVRVSDPAGGEIWLFPSQLLVQVPDLFGQIETSELESRLPRFLETRQVFSTPLWRVIVFVLLIPVSLGLSWAIVRLLRAGQRIWLRWRHNDFLEDIYDSMAAPATIALTVVFHQVGVHLMGIPLLIQVYYQRVTGVVLVAALTWLFLRLVSRWGERARLKALDGSVHSSDSILLLGQRMLKGAVGIVAVLIVIKILGFDMTTVLAGLGIGSLAIAFAAQKTLENLLGGMSIIGDQVIRVGETCRIGDQIGTVEDISLRSTRIRTRNRTQLSVPNGQLANMNVENLSRSDTSLFQANIALRYETSLEQLRSLLKDIRDLLRRHPGVDSKSVRVRFVGFGESSLDVEINCHILTGDLEEFFAIREELLFRIVEVIAGAGVEFAFPSRTLYITQDWPYDQQRRAAKEVSRSRHQG